MQKQKLIIIIGIVSGLIGAFLVKVYLDQQRSYIQQQEKQKSQKIQENLVPVLIAKKDIPKGSTVESDSLEVTMTPKQSVQPQAVTSLDRVSGMTTVIPISKGEQITLNKLIWPREASSGSNVVAGTLAMVTPVGKRAITIQIDNIASLSGMIKPGDYVDVIALIPVPSETADKKQTVQAAVMPLFQNVLILAVGRDISTPAKSSSLQEANRYSKSTSDDKGDKTSPSPASQLLTLALAPQEASLIAFVQEQGKIRLTLRSPADSQVHQAMPTTWDTLFKYVMPAQQAAAKDGAEAKDAAAAKQEAIEYVEIYRGLKKEKIPISK